MHALDHDAGTHHCHSAIHSPVPKMVLSQNDVVHKTVLSSAKLQAVVSMHPSVAVLVCSSGPCLPSVKIALKAAGLDMQPHPKWMSWWLEALLACQLTTALRPHMLKSTFVFRSDRLQLNYSSALGCTFGCELMRSLPVLALFLPRAGLFDTVWLALLLPKRMKPRQRQRYVGNKLLDVG